MAGTSFGFGTPFTTPTAPTIPWAFSPYGIQGQGQHPLQQQIYQLLQIVPQQLQALQQLGYQQQQQLQQLAQIVPGQLAQLQQLIQVVLQQFQQTQQPLGQIAGLGSYGVAAPWGVTPQLFGNQPAQIM